MANATTDNSGDIAVLPDPEEWRRRYLEVERLRENALIKHKSSHEGKAYYGRFPVDWARIFVHQPSYRGQERDSYFASGWETRSELGLAIAARDRDVWHGIFKVHVSLETIKTRLVSSTRRRARVLGWHFQKFGTLASKTLTHEYEEKRLQILLQKEVALDSSHATHSNVTKGLKLLKDRFIGGPDHGKYRDFRYLEMRSFETKRKLERALGILQEELRQWERLDRELAEQELDDPARMRLNQELADREAICERPYQYSPLTAPTQFRVLKLSSRAPWSSALVNAAELQDDLVCSIHTFDLATGDYPPFEALSYEWRSKPPDAELRKIQHNLFVRTDTDSSLKSIGTGYNLQNALKHVRHAKDDTWIWADAVCIDQSKFDERAHQVKLMGEIYSRAEKVLAWLPVQDSTYRQFSVTDLGSLLGFSAQDRSNYRHNYCELLKSTYWTRKWIIQEIILARTVVLVAGDMEFPMKDLEDRLETNPIKQHRHDYRTDPTAFEVASWPVAKLASHRRYRRAGVTHPQTLHQLLPLYARNKCKEALDHVYALYNLIGEHRKHLDVDYGKSPSVWFMDVLKFLDRHEQQAKFTLFDCAILLSKMISHSDLFAMGLSSPELATHFTLSLFHLGNLVHQEECDESNKLRKHVRSLHPGIRWTFRKSNEVWIIDQKDQSDTERVNPRVLRYFEVPVKRICGMAATRLQQGDRVWQLPNQKLAFIARLDGSRSQMRILGRCYLFDFMGTRSAEPPTSSKLSLDEARQLGEQAQCYDLRLSLSDMFTLGYCGASIDYIDHPHSDSPTQVQVRPKRRPVPEPDSTAIGRASQATSTAL